MSHEDRARSGLNLMGRQLTMELGTKLDGLGLLFGIEVKRAVHRHLEEIYDTLCEAGEGFSLFAQQHHDQIAQMAEEGVTAREERDAHINTLSHLLQTAVDEMARRSARSRRPEPSWTADARRAISVCGPFAAWLRDQVEVVVEP